MTRSELIAALQAGPGSDALDAEVLAAHGLPPGCGLRVTQWPPDTCRMVEGMGWTGVYRYGGNSPPTAELSKGDRHKSGRAPDCALALCVASFKEG